MSLLITIENSLDPDHDQPWSGFKLFDMLLVFLKEFFEKVDFEKNQMTKKHEKLPSMLKVQSLLITENSVDSSETFARDYFIGYYIMYYGLTLFILDTGKQVL